jgi:hypothetical protein
LRKRDAVFNNVVPDLNRIIDVLFAVSFDLEHIYPIFSETCFCKHHLHEE